MRPSSFPADADRARIRIAMTGIDLAAIHRGTSQSTFEAGLALVGLAIAAAHLLACPRLLRASLRAGSAMLIASATGLAALGAVLWLQPRAIFWAALGYAAFLVACGTAATARTPDRFIDRRRCLLGSGLIAAAAALGGWAAWLPS